MKLVNLSMGASVSKDLGSTAEPRGLRSLACKCDTICENEICDHRGSNSHLGLYNKQTKLSNFEKHNLSAVKEYTVV